MTSNYRGTGGTKEQASCLLLELADALNGYQENKQLWNAVLDNFDDEDTLPSWLHMLCGLVPDKLRASCQWLDPESKGASSGLSEGCLQIRLTPVAVWSQLLQTGLVAKEAPRELVPLRSEQVCALLGGLLPRPFYRHSFPLSLLDLTGHQVDDVVMQHLCESCDLAAGRCRLREIVLQNAEVTTRGALWPLSCCVPIKAQLQRLDLSGCAGIIWCHPLPWAFLFRWMPRLRSLCLQNTGLDQVGVRKVLNALRQSPSLSCLQCFKVGSSFLPDDSGWREETLAALLALVPLMISLQVLEVWGSNGEQTSRIASLWERQHPRGGAVITTEVIGDGAGWRIASTPGGALCQLERLPLVAVQFNLPVNQAVSGGGPKSAQQDAWLDGLASRSGTMKAHPPGLGSHGPSPATRTARVKDQGAGSRGLIKKPLRVSGPDQHLQVAELERLLGWDHLKQARRSQVKRPKQTARPSLKMKTTQGCVGHWGVGLDSGAKDTRNFPVQGKGQRHAEEWQEPKFRWDGGEEQSKENVMGGKQQGTAPDDKAEVSRQHERFCWEDSLGCQEQSKSLAGSDGSAAPTPQSLSVQRWGQGAHEHTSLWRSSDTVDGMARQGLCTGWTQQPKQMHVGLDLSPEQPHTTLDRGNARSGLKSKDGQGEDAYTGLGEEGKSLMQVCPPSPPLDSYEEDSFIRPDDSLAFSTSVEEEERGAAREVLARFRQDEWDDKVKGRRKKKEGRVEEGEEEEELQEREEEQEIKVLSRGTRGPFSEVEKHKERSLHQEQQKSSVRKRLKRVWSGLGCQGNPGLIQPRSGEEGDDNLSVHDAWMSSEDEGQGRAEHKDIVVADYEQVSTKKKSAKNKFKEEIKTEKKKKKKKKKKHSHQSDKHKQGTKSVHGVAAGPLPHFDEDLEMALGARSSDVCQITKVVDGGAAHAGLIQPSVWERELRALQAFGWDKRRARHRPGVFFESKKGSQEKRRKDDDLNVLMLQYAKELAACRKLAPTSGSRLSNAPSSSSSSSRGWMSTGMSVPCSRVVSQLDGDQSATMGQQCRSRRSRKRAVVLDSEDECHEAAEDLLDAYLPKPPLQSLAGGDDPGGIEVVEEMEAEEAEHIKDLRQRIGSTESLIAWLMKDIALAEQPVGDHKQPSELAAAGSYGAGGSNALVVYSQQVRGETSTAVEERVQLTSGVKDVTGSVVNTGVLAGLRRQLAMAQRDWRRLQKVLRDALPFSWDKQKEKHPYNSSKDQPLAGGKRVSKAPLRFSPNENCYSSKSLAAVDLEHKRASRPSRQVLWDKADRRLPSGVERDLLEPVSGSQGRHGGASEAAVHSDFEDHLPVLEVVHKRLRRTNRQPDGPCGSHVDGHRPKRMSLVAEGHLSWGSHGLLSVMHSEAEAGRGLLADEDRLGLVDSGGLPDDNVCNHQPVMRELQADGVETGQSSARGDLVFQGGPKPSAEACRSLVAVLLPIPYHASQVSGAPQTGVSPSGQPLVDVGAIRSGDEEHSRSPPHTYPYHQYLPTPVASRLHPITTHRSLAEPYDEIIPDSEEEEEQAAGGHQGSADVGT